jgi:hypothetical protein
VKEALVFLKEKWMGWIDHEIFPILTIKVWKGDGRRSGRKKKNKI